ncbi:MAG TPA: preprotein translocase subunit YajC [Terriglobales bacterium]
MPSWARRNLKMVLPAIAVQSRILLQGIDLAAEIILLGISGRLALWLQLPGGTSLLGLAPLLFIFAIFYFLLIMPQQRKQKKWQAMLSELKNGDKIVTSGGLRGTIISLKDDALTLRVPPDNVKLEISRASVVSVTTAEEGK